MRRFSFSQVYLSGVQLAVIVLPAVAAFQASRLGVDLETILGGFGLIGTYIVAVGWILGGEGGSDWLRLRVRQGLVRVLTNQAAITILAVGLLLLNLFLVRTLFSYNLTTPQREALRRYSRSLITLSDKMLANAEAIIKESVRLYSQRYALEQQTPLLREAKRSSTGDENPGINLIESIAKFGEGFSANVKKFKGIGLLLQQLAQDEPKSWATRRQAPILLDFDFVHLGELPIQLEVSQLLSSSSQVSVVLANVKQQETALELLRNIQQPFDKLIEHLASWHEIAQVGVLHTQGEIEYRISLEFLGSVDAMQRVQLGTILNEATGTLQRVTTYQTQLDNVLQLVGPATQELIDVLTGTKGSVVQLDALSSRTDSLIY